MRFLVTQRPYVTPTRTQHKVRMCADRCGSWARGAEYVECVRQAFRNLVGLGVRPDQSHSEQRRIRTVNVVALVAFSATAFFGTLFFIATDGGAASVRLYAVANPVFLAGYGLTLVLNWRGNHRGAVLLVQTTGVANLVVATLTGGFATGSAVFLVAVAMAAVLVTPLTDRLVRWGFVVLSVIAFAMLAIIDPPVPSSIAGTWFETFLLVSTYAGMVTFVVAIGWYQRLLADTAEEALSEANERSERLLLNILPADIAVRLKANEYPIAERKRDIAVLFADIVGSTSIAEQLTADDLVATLDGLFSSFDDITDAFGLEKIKTVGDNYFAVAGLAPNSDNHVASAADAVLRMRDELVHHAFPGIGPIHMRFGLHVGPVVAGVIGKRKFSYDLWGDTVNTASRMESTSDQDVIQVSQQIYDQLKNDYELRARGNVSIKGKGELPTYELVERRTPPNRMRT